jgi:hypothetical protein
MVALIEAKEAFLCKYAPGPQKRIALASTFPT